MGPVRHKKKLPGKSRQKFENRLVAKVEAALAGDRLKQHSSVARGRAIQREIQRKRMLTLANVRAAREIQEEEDRRIFALLDEVAGVNRDEGML